MRIATPIALAMISAAAFACGRSQPPAASVAAPATELARERIAVLRVDVKTTRIARGVIQPRVSAPGSIVARRVSHIGAEVRGRIEKILVDEGDRVAAGDALFEIDREPFEIALRQAQAGLALARSERQQIHADLRRLDKLQKKAIVAIDQRDRMRTNVAVAKARETQAAESVALALHNLGQTIVVAPFGGSIAARLVDEGTTALVQPQTIVVVLHETAELEAQANIPESQLAVIRVGDPARVHVGDQTAPIETEVASVSDTIDATTRTYRVRMRIQNADHRLKAGVFARIDIFPREKRDVLLVPRESVRSEAGHTSVLLVRDGRAQAVPVRLGMATGTHAEVLSGLDVDSEVIVGESAREIAPGMRVRVISEEARATP
jgi:RND family efflux transporter MFP subunit